MRIKKKIERTGRFWLPAEPDRKVTGRFSISDGGYIELKLIGSLVAFNEKVERIIGQIEREGSVTLDECFCTSYKSTQGVEKSSIRVNLVHTGIPHGENDVPLINSLIFSVEGIDEWVGISGISFDPQPEVGCAAILYQQPPDISFDLGRGLQLSIVFRHSWSVKMPLIREAKINQKTYFRLVSQNPLELAAFTSVAEKITTFLCFAMGEIVCLDRMSAFIDDSRRDEEEQKTGTIPIDVYYPSWPYSKSMPKVDRVKLFEFERIRNDAERVMSNWINGDEEIASAFNFYFWTQIEEAQHLDEKFLTLVRGLEALHRRISFDEIEDMSQSAFEQLVEHLVDRCPVENRKWLERKLKYANQVSLRKRLKSLIKPFQDLFGDEKKVDKLTNRIVDLRNYLTHLDPAKKSVFRGEELPLLCHKMELLFQLHFLDLVGFSREEIHTIIRHVEPLQRWFKS